MKSMEIESPDREEITAKLDGSMAEEKKKKN